MSMQPGPTLLLAAALLAGGAAAQSTPSVTVAATRDPVNKSYRKMIAGMDTFARWRQLAPHATLRFQLLPRHYGTVLDGLVLRVAGDTVSLPVPVAPDHTFTLERDQRALLEDAVVVASGKASSLTWRAQVRSPNLPDGMRRLGDLRLECRVGVAAGLLSDNAQWFAWLGELLTSPEQVCDAPDGHYLFFAERPLAGVTLFDGNRSANLPVTALYAGGTQSAASLRHCDCEALLDRSYYAPIWDRSWSDETLLSFKDQPPLE